jgi:hypothetical protein
MPQTAVTVTANFSTSIPTTPIFNDVPRSVGSTTFNAVQWAGANGIIQGSGGNFLPQRNMTRLEFAQILYRFAGNPAVGAIDKDDQFDDVDYTRSTSTAVTWANGAKIVTGANGKFEPNRSITREEMVLMLYRYETGGTGTVNRNVLNPFADRASINPHALDAMSWAVANGYIRGLEGNLLPKNEITRAEVAVIFFRYAV